MDTSDLRSNKRGPLAAAVVITLHAAAIRAAEQQLPKIAVEASEDGYAADVASSPKYTEVLRDTPQTINIIPKAVIEQRGAASLTEVLRNVSGISLVAGEGGGARGDNLRIRGFAANTDLFIDGMRDIAQYARDPFNLEAIEVAKGPGSLFTGRGSTGGAINQVSKSPQQDLFIASSAALGTDDYRRATADLNVPLAGSFAVRLNAMYHDADIAGRDIVHQQRWGAAPAVAWGLGTQTRAVLSYLALDQDNITDYGLPSVAGVVVPGLRHENWYGFKDLNVERARTDLLTLRVEHDFTAAITWRNQLRYSENELYSIVSPPRNANVATNTITRNPSVRDSANDLRIAQSDLQLRLGRGTLRHAIVTGFEIATEGYDNVSYASVSAPVDNLREPNPSTPFAPRFTATQLQNNEADTLAFYALDTISIGEKWLLSAGVRWDDFAAETVTRTTAGAHTQLNSNDAMTSWRAGALYKPREAGSIYIAYGTSFNPSAETGVIAANISTLDPEKSRSYELGTKWDLFNARLALSSAVFRTEKTNARTNDGSANALQVLAGEQRVDGFEINISGSITPRWAALAGYTYMDGEILSSQNAAEVGNPTGHTPKHSFNLWTTFRPLSRLELGLGAQHVSARTVSNTVTTWLPDYWLIDAAVSYEVTEHFALYFNALNLLDEFYFEKFHGGGSHAIPGAARTLQLRANVSF